MVEEVKQAVHIYTIKNKIPLFKGEEQANSIEYIELEEVGNRIVAAKDLHSVGDKVVFIEPDYSLPDTSLFESFHRPYGDPKKSILGSHGRIKAKKFTLHTGDGVHIYSYGILLPANEVDLWISNNVNGLIDSKDLTQALGIFKYEEPEDGPKSHGLKVNGGKEKPSDLYKTDEENINNLWGHIKFPIQLTGRIKEDGSSITIWYRNGNYGICSRTMSKPLTITKVVGYREPTLWETIKSWFGVIPDLKVYHTGENDDMFVKHGKPYLDKLVEYCKQNNIYGVALRGELRGSGARGSGNKNNPASKLPTNIRWYGVDDYTQQAFKKNENEFNTIMEQLNFTPCEHVFTETFTSREHLESVCNEYFKSHLVEGIVVRNFDHSFSAKVMNLDYDSKK